MPSKLINELMGFDPSANVAAATARVDLFRSNSEKMKELAETMRSVVKAQCDSYKDHVIDTYLDCDYKKVKICKRVPKARKSSWNVCK